ncbi:hypothetical protein ACMFMG_010640 [Clarireedia jacksonii]
MSLSFYSFPKLPVEVREMIWMKALAEERIIIFDFKASIKMWLRLTPEPALFHVNNESKNIASKYYKYFVCQTKPSIQQPSIQQPSIQQPSIQQPSIQQSSIQQPSIQQPSIQQSSIQQPSIQQSSIQQPSIQQPSIQQPSIQQPSIQQPSIQQSSIQQPSIQQSSIQQPSIQQPSIQQPSIQQPSIQQPSIQQSSIQQPSIQQSSIQQPSIQQPSIQQPSIQQPSIQQPSIQQPSIQQSSIQQPSIQQPSIQQPSIQQSSIQQPSIQQPSIQQTTHINPDNDICYFLTPKGLYDNEEMFHKMCTFLDDNCVPYCAGVRPRRWAFDVQLLISRSTSAEYRSIMMNWMGCILNRMSWCHIVLGDEQVDEFCIIISDEEIADIIRQSNKLRSVKVSSRDHVLGPSLKSAKEDFQKEILNVCEEVGLYQDSDGYSKPPIVSFGMIEL